ncbi:MAG: hypothetical protein MUC36_08750 [Planctomycetes bacterium]|jgi:hypothetical protein|nr:hypothetical protein [Planctomycetota bacterium]
MHERSIVDHVPPPTTTTMMTMTMMMTMMTRNDAVIAIVSLVIISMHGVETDDSTLHSTRSSC